MSDDRIERKDVPRPAPLERQKGRPMWGCVRAIVILTVGALVVLFLSIGGGYYYLGTSNFAGLIKLRIERNLESHLGRDVTIGKVTFFRTRPTRVILDDLRIANAPGASTPWLATIRQIEITGGVDSFWRRVIRLGRIEVRDPRLYFEVFPVEAPLDHNFPQWKRSAPRKYEITRLEIDKMYVTGGGFEFLDRRHQIVASAYDLSSEVTPIFRKQIYEGISTSPRIVVKLKDYQPFELEMRGAFHYKPGSLELKSVALRGRGIETFLKGRIDPLTEAAYDFTLSSSFELERAKEIFEIEKRLAGLMLLNGRLRGKSGVFVLDGGYSIPSLSADAYDLASMRGTTRITNDEMSVDIDSAEYGGGTISGRYDLAKYEEPYPMKVALHYSGVSIEKLFEDWDLKSTGLRGSARGDLRYAWNKDDLLGGNGEGRAAMQPGARAFGNARYPIPVGGSADFALDRGVVSFRPAALTTPKSEVGFTGTLRIEDLAADLGVEIRSDDFSELDRIAFNFARATDNADFDLLGLGGSGRITGTIKGTLKEPDVAARVDGAATAYNNVVLGDSAIDLRYDGNASRLTFDPAAFTLGESRLTITGDVVFPDRGPSPRFDVRVAADNYPVERAMDAVELDFDVSGSGTGEVRVAGTPDQGETHFENLRIARDDSRLSLNGLIAWQPGEGNVRFDLDIGAESFAVSELIAFLELGSIPVEGALTGTLHIEGPKSALEGAGAVTIRDGSIAGETVELARAELLFTAGRMRATDMEIRLAGGVITGEADYDFEAERFGYVIESTDLEISRIKTLAPLAGVVGGRLRIVSSGSGTAERPEIELEATLLDARIGGSPPPEGSVPPTISLSIREGNMSIRGALFGVATVEGKGTISPSGEVDGTVQARIDDVSKFLQIVAPEAALPAAGSLVVDVRLGGKLSPLEALVAEGSVSTLDLTLSDHRLTAAEPIRFALRGGRLELDSFRLVSAGSEFSIAGFIGVTGDQTMSLSVRGLVEAALFQLFVPGLKADGHLDVAADLTGTMKAPRINGTVEVQNAELRPPGFPQIIDEITGTLDFRSDRVEISIRARVGGGTVVAGGSVDLDGMALQTIRLKLQGTDVSIRYFEGLTIDGDFELRLSGDAERTVLQGEVTVDRALYYKDFDFGTSLLNLILERRGLVPEVAASWQDRVNLRIRMTAPQTLAVRNNVADITGSAEVDLRGTLANPVLDGLVTVDEGGSIEFQNVKYRVVRGTINFQNPFRIDPYFDLTAEGRLQEYDLTINLTGTLDRITPTITSDPPVSDLTLLTLLSGSLDSGTAPLSAESLTSAGTSLLVQSVGGLIGSKVFPFADSFRIEAGGGLESLSSFTPTVTFEKQVSDDLRVILIFNTFDQHNREIVEWQVTRDWILLFTRNSETEEYALDARFRRRYDGRW